MILIICISVKVAIAPRCISTLSVPVSLCFRDDEYCQTATEDLALIIDPLARM